MIGILSSIKSSLYQFAWRQWLSPHDVQFLSTEDVTSFSGKIIAHGLESEHAALTIPLENASWWLEDFPDIQRWRSFLAQKNYSRALPEDDFLWAVGYLYARLDEYLPETSDALGRFITDAAIQQSWSGIDIPYLDHWRVEFYRRLQFQDSYTIQKKLTIDVDSAFAFKYKGLYRTMGGFVKDIVRGDWFHLKERCRILFLGQHDPYDTYDWIQSITKQHGWSLNYFLLVADFGKYDTGLPFSSAKFRQWAADLARKNQVGWHPGFASHEDESRWRDEVRRIQLITRGQCMSARMHFLKMKMPRTYRHLLSSGITEDYTLGFAHDIGFRAGTSRPFCWYDWEAQEETKLKLVPFVYMDVTLRKYLVLSPSDAIQKMDVLSEEIKESQGDWVVLWHNESVNDYHEWNGWQQVLIHTLKQ
jgi:hypothetical protein